MIDSFSQSTANNDGTTSGALYREVDDHRNRSRANQPASESQSSPRTDGSVMVAQLGQPGAPQNDAPPARAQGDAQPARTPEAQQRAREIEELRRANPRLAGEEATRAQYLQQTLTNLAGV